ncbi:TonB-dependent receptor [Flavobacterium akiainvivens]|uniref:TonB-dependent receptor n=1 Tax=Flavobacterium akiainvivens TaxID=1202724 RepID=A0A0M8M9X7_9FLAO|nr:TonB-dependent receptor [Flavobacterium akiainvivens]KOS06643.1 TonB-dependent receptor [Flavobacterium akiainvivens]SFQ70321.1 iron complex outermembrane recepter protein [Flavobacterium akiainvivens]
MKILFEKATELLSRLATEPQSRKIVLAAATLTSVGAFAQQPVQQDTITQLDEVLVQSVRATGNTPVTFSNVSKEELAPRNLGQDIPSLLNYLPSVVTTTDAGNGIGYSGIRVRGADASRVNVTINGIPYNDAESQGTFWVNMPDFASSAQNIQLQRGVGTSTNGAGAFGASLNVLTDTYKHKAEGEISNSFGSFNSRKHTVKFSSGLMNDRFELAGRLSNIESDGYIDRATSSLKSFFLQGTYAGNTTLIKALVFGGSERTYQAWNGIDAATMAENRRFNYSGMYTDANGETRFYNNETDNYWQDHYQLHWSERINDNWSTNVALHYTKGKGYYENYRDNDTYADYGLANVVVNGVTITEEDLITRKWLDNDFYGTTFSANYKNEGLNVIVGGAWNKYEGAHFGEVIWARYSANLQPDDHYYDDDAVKTDFNVYAKANYNITNALGIYADLQYRTVNYTADGVLADPVDDTFNFVNPKAGLTYALGTNNTLYFSYARGNKEPRRNDYENGSSKPESLNDFELGWRYNTGKTAINVNGYYMRYKDQLVLTGQLDDVGAPIYTNSGDSFRLGLEADATIALTESFVLRPNIAVSANKNVDFFVEGEAGPQNLGDTEIAFSPSVIGANQLIFHKNGWFAMLATKYVGEQFMDNLETAGAKLKAYTTTDINVAYTFKPKAVFTEVTLSGLVNNIFDEEYSSNGFYYEGAYYYPQAGVNFLAGLTLKF